MLSPGTILGGDFRVLEPLQTGGMGAVFVAEQLSTGQRRALKVMHATLVQQPRLRERFEQEARVGSRIASDHVVQVIGAGIDPARGIPWLAMELLHGQTLASAIEARGRFGFEQLLGVFRPLCHALGAAHAVGVIHRDIKPENVFLATAQSVDRDVNVKVLDFGIAKLVAEARDTGTANVGTPLWMAPEQTDHRAEIGPATDIWPLGLIAYRMLTGQYYWRSANDPSGSVQSLLREGLIDAIAPASSRAAEQGAHGVLPPGFDDWFARAVHRDPRARFQSAAEALHALERLGSTTSVSAASGAPPEHVTSTASRALPTRAGRRTGWLAAGALGFLALGAVALLGIGTTLFVFQDEIGQALLGAPGAKPAPSSTSTNVAPAAATDTNLADGSAPSASEPSAGKKPGAVGPPAAHGAAKTASAPAPPSASAPSTSGLAPFNRAAATAKVNAAVANAKTSCKAQKGDAAAESYSGSIGFNPDGSRSMFFQGPGGARECVRGILGEVRIPKYAPDPKDPWKVDVVQFTVTIL